MIRLKFVDTFCDSLQEFKAFLSSHAGDEKNRYHISVAEKFRSGLLEKWLLQEESVQSGRGNGQEAALLHSLAEAVHKAKDTMDSDRAIYAWLMRVFCAMTDAFTPSSNPFRFIDVVKLVARYDGETQAFSGYLIYEVLDPAMEAFDLKVKLHEESAPLRRVSADQKKDVRWKLSFSKSVPMSVDGENLAALSFALDDYEIPANKVFAYMETGIEDIYYAANDGRVFISRREADSFLIKTPEITSRPEDIFWILRQCGMSSMADIHKKAAQAGEQELNKAIAEARFSLTHGNYPSLSLLFAASTSLSQNRIRNKGEESYLKEFDQVKDEALDLYASFHNGFHTVSTFNNQGVAVIETNGQKQFICYDGRILIPCFKKVWLVGEGLAAISTSSGKTVFVSIDGDEKISTEGLSDMSVFSEGYLAVRRADTGDWGYMTRDGSIFGSYEKAGDFHYGRATVFKKSTTGDRWLSIDTDFNERVLSSPPSTVLPSKSPCALDGMIVKETDLGSSLITDDDFPVPVMFNLPELGESKLFEL